MGLGLRSGRVRVSNEAMQAVRSMPALTTLKLNDCRKITDVGVLAVSVMTALMSLTLALGELGEGLALGAALGYGAKAKD